MKDKNTLRLPELLAPAGSPKALEAAIDGGADAVYFGASTFNARIGAENFSDAALAEAFELCHAYGVKSYITLNTLAHDRELGDFLRTAENVWKLGADAIIIADLGAAMALKAEIPEIVLHASTQMSGHNAGEAKLLSSLGYSRMVLARETSLADIREFTKNSPIEAEVFIHGALCVSHSGQCLFSSVVGGRSGNRGECAQPCRLPYAEKEKYPLSLRDLCLAPYIPELIDAHVASLKIEGRMKSPEYVREVTSVYRTLLDERRGADASELSRLAAAFTRGGFTSAYFTGNIMREKMLGTRSDTDKENSRALETFDKITRKRPIDIKAEFSAGVPSRLTLCDGEKEVTVTGDVPDIAVNVPMTEESVLKNLTKLGGTPFCVGRTEISIDGKLMLPVSKLNSLRRDGISAIVGSAARPSVAHGVREEIARGEQKSRLDARFIFPENITEHAARFFERIYIPLEKYAEPYNEIARGVIMPPVVFDHEADEVLKMLRGAKKLGAEYVLVGNLGHLELAREAGLVPVGDFRLNIYSRETLSELQKLGFSDPILSPELTLPQMRDIGGPSGTLVYGRIPLMLLEKCAIREIASCEVCERGKAALTDRKGVSFPIIREWKHRNVIYNSLPTYMGDKKELLDRNGITCRHFIFTTESRQEVDRVIRAYGSGEELGIAVRRIKS